MTTILIIEDNENFRTALRTELETNGFHVQEAENGNSGAFQFKSHQPHLVLTDLIMADGEGIETIRKIRDIKPDARIIAMSGNPDYLNHSKKLGADQILLKPFRINQLIRAIEATGISLPT